MDAASLHSTLFAGATEVEVGQRIGRLRLFNTVMGVLHAVQGAAILVLATSFTLPIVTYPLTGPPGSPAETITLFDLRIAWAVAAFLFISAVAHLVVASPIAFPTYERMLLSGRNDYRWVEYSLSASLMAVLIALLSGISDAAALIAIFGVNAAMIFFGLIPGALRASRREDAALLARLRGGCLPVALDRDIPGWDRHGRPSTRIRLRDLRLTVCLLHVLRRGSVAAVPAGRALEGLSGG